MTASETVQFGNACFTHCCPRHGCKYGYENDEFYPDKTCPISKGLARPVYPNNNGCEMCAPERDAIDAGKKMAENWNICDPQSSIPVEAAKQIALAAVEAYNKSGDWSVD